MLMSTGFLMESRVPTYAAYTGHNPTSGIIIERHLRGCQPSRSTPDTSKRSEPQSLGFKCSTVTVLSVPSNQLEK